MSLLLALLLSQPALADDAVSVKPELSGSIAVAGGPDTVAMTMGGPRVTLQHDKVRISASFFPSLLYDVKDWKQVRPSLGFGLELSVGHLAVVAPVYYVDTYRPTLGLGYRF